MKVLQFPAYTTIQADKEFSRSATGYGYMTFDIASSIARSGVEVDLLTQVNFTTGKKCGQVNLLKHSWFNIISNFKLRFLFQSVNQIFRDHIRQKKMPNILLYYLNMGYFEKLVRKNRYDIIHIHGIGYYTIPIIKSCLRNQYSFVVTLHGLNSFSNSVQVSESEKNIEKYFIKQAEIDNITYTVISSGIKKTILDFLNIDSSKNCHTILNGCDTDIDNITNRINLREAYNIPINAKIMLSIGNICNRKNQEQIVRAYSKLDTKHKEKLVILFLGSDTTNGRFERAISELKINNGLIYCGNIPKKELYAYYDQADYNIVASLNEGFGLSIIEGFVFGLPTITFNDLDAIPDLYHEKTMQIVFSRTDEALAEGITQFISNKWDKYFIKNYSKKFSLKVMAKKYIQLYQNIINEVDKE